MNTFDPTNPHNDPLDYRWALNIGELHPGADFDNGARPMVQLNDGVLFTANRSRFGLDPKLTNPDKPLEHVAADLAASFDLTGSDMVSITWEEPGGPKEFKIPRSKPLIRLDLLTPSWYLTILRLRTRRRKTSWTFTTEC